MITDSLFHGDTVANSITNEFSPFCGIQASFDHRNPSAWNRIFSYPVIAVHEDLTLMYWYYSCQGIIPERSSMLYQLYIELLCEVCAFGISCLCSKFFAPLGC